MVFRFESTSQKEWLDVQFSALKAAIFELDGDGPACCCLRCGDSRKMLGADPRDLDDGGKVFDSTLAHELVKASNGILLEMG